MLRELTVFIESIMSSKDTTDKYFEETSFSDTATHSKRSALNSPDYAKRRRKNEEQQEINSIMFKMNAAIGDKVIL